MKIFEISDFIEISFCNPYDNFSDFPVGRLFLIHRKFYEKFVSNFQVLSKIN
jgi:hypothetical protein